MRYSYYPGCTLKTDSAAVLESSALKAASALEIELVEQEEWQCCGAVFPLAADETAGFLSSVRSLAAAREAGQKLVTICAACHHVLKRANHVMRHKQESREKVNNYLELEKEYSGETEVLHFLELLRDEVGFARLQEKVTKPLMGRKIAPYYGCLLLRPPNVMAFDDAENPTIMEDFLRVLGAEPVPYPYRTECCGVFLSLKYEEVASDMVHKIVSSARRAGAEALVDACPLCHYNLLELQEKKPGDFPLPAFYFTELLAEALGL